MQQSVNFVDLDREWIRFGPGYPLQAGKVLDRSYFYGPIAYEKPSYGIRELA